MTKVKIQLMNPVYSLLFQHCDSITQNGLHRPSNGEHNVDLLSVIQSKPLKDKQPF